MGKQWRSLDFLCECVCVYTSIGIIKNLIQSSCLEKFRRKPQQRQTEARSGPPGYKRLQMALSKSVLLERELQMRNPQPWGGNIDIEHRKAPVCPCLPVPLFLCLRNGSSFWILVNPLLLKLMTNQNLLALLHISLPISNFNCPGQ